MIIEPTTGDRYRAVVRLNKPNTYRILRRHDVISPSGVSTSKCKQVVEIFYDEYMVEHFGCDNDKITESWRNLYDRKIDYYMIISPSGRPMTWSNSRLNDVHIPLLSTYDRPGLSVGEFGETVTLATPNEKHVNYKPEMENWEVCIFRRKI